MEQTIKELKKKNKELSRALEIERDRRIEAEKFIERFRSLFSDLLDDVFKYRETKYRETED